MSTIKKTTDMGWTHLDGKTWEYTVLSEPLLTSELERIAFAKSIGDTDVVSAQPSPHYEHRNQDRYAIQDWNLPGGTWSFRAIFDGQYISECLV